MSGPDVRAREAEAQAAKDQFMTTLHTLQHRLSPKTIAGDVAESVKDKATDAANAGISVANRGVAEVRNRPASVAAVAVPVLVFLFRKPIARGLSALSRRNKPTEKLAADGDMTPYEAARAPAQAAAHTAPQSTAKKAAPANKALAEQGA